MYIYMDNDYYENILLCFYLSSSYRLFLLYFNMANVSQPNHDTIDQWLTEWSGLLASATKLKLCQKCKVEKRLHEFRPCSTPDVFMYCNLIEKEKSIAVTSKTIADLPQRPLLPDFNLSITGLAKVCHS